MLNRASSLVGRIVSGLMATFCFLAWAERVEAESKGAGRAQVFVVGLSPELSRVADQITRDLRRVLLPIKELVIPDLAERLQSPPTDKIKQLETAATRELAEARARLRAMEYGAVVAHAGKARGTFEKMGGYLSALDDYKESILLLGVGESMRGNADSAKSVFVDLLQLDPQFTLSRKDYHGVVLQLFEDVRQNLVDLPKGTLSVETDPRGASFFLDGRLRGITPQSADRLPSANHLVAVKLPGYQSVGKIVRIEPGTLAAIDFKLQPGKTDPVFERLVGSAARALSKDGSRGDLQRLGETVGLDWAWLCQLKKAQGGQVLDCFLFDFGTAQVVYQESLRLEGADRNRGEQLERFGKGFLTMGFRALSDRRKVEPPGAVSAEGEVGAKGAANTAETGKPGNSKTVPEQQGQKETKGTDPLDEVDGTEDW